MKLVDNDFDRQNDCCYTVYFFPPLSLLITCTILKQLLLVSQTPTAKSKNPVNHLFFYEISSTTCTMVYSLYSGTTQGTTNIGMYIVHVQLYIIIVHYYIIAMKTQKTLQYYESMGIPQIRTIIDHRTAERLFFFFSHFHFPS